MNTSKKTKIREIENHLRHYKSYKAGIKNLQQQLEWIMPNMTASYEVQEGSSGTFNISSKVETAVLDRLEGRRALNLHDEIQTYQMVLKNIDEAIEALDERDKTLVVERYINKKSITEVADILCVSESYVHKMKQRILDELYISLKSLFT